MKLYLFLLICSHFLCIHSLILRPVGRQGLRRIDSFLRPVQMIRLDQRNLGVQRYYEPPRTLAYSYGSYDFMCQLCRYYYGPNSCSLYCSHPYPRQPPNLGVGGLRSTI